jgi:hypothetical protein
MPAPNDRNAERLQTDERMFRWKVIAGVASLCFLVALFVTSLERSPNPVYTVVVAVATALLAVAIVHGVRRRRRPR